MKTCAECQSSLSSGSAGMCLYCTERVKETLATMTTQFDRLQEQFDEVAKGWAAANARIAELESALAAPGEVAHAAE